MFHLFGTYGVTLADEAALHMRFLVMGSGGLKCCILCKNCFDGITLAFLLELGTSSPAIVRPSSGHRAREAIAVPSRFELRSK